MTVYPLLLAALLQPLLRPAALGETIRFSTDEEAPPGTVVGVLAEALPVEQRAGGFRLLQQAGNGWAVRVRARDGQLSVGAARLDREALCGPAEEPCVLPFDVVSLGGVGGAQYRLLHVELEVRDINDHAPRFPQAVLALEVSESAAPGTRLPLELARDPDAGSNGVQSFALSPPDGPFGLEAQSRADGRKGAELVLLRELDREARAAYRLELVAKDGGRPARSGTATLSVRVLDANDNAPAFPRGALLTLELPEDAPPGALLLELAAADPDEGANGQLLYSWGSQVPPEARRLFALDPLSGRLSLRAALDYELQRAYELDVQASDRGASPLAASCKVLVRLLDVNDNAPALAVSALASPPAGPEGGPGLGPALALVSEAAAPQSLVALVSASDGDAGANGQVRLALLPAAPQPPFALQRAYEASYLLLTAAPLDRERVPEYNLTLVAEDLGSPPARTERRLTVRLADENDNAPRFAEARYELALPENNAPGASLAALRASDPDVGANGRLAYRLLDGPGPGPAGDASLATYLSLDPATGALYAARAFDYELLKQLQVTVQAVDGGSPPLSGTALVRLRVVDQNDNAPLITHPPLRNGSAELPLPLGVPAGFPIARLAASDADAGPNGELAFSLRAPEPFAIQPRTGELFLRQRLPAGAASQAAFLLAVAVEDCGRPALTSTAALRLIPTDALPSSVQMVALQPAPAREGPLDPSVVLIGLLAGGCGVLLVAILLVAASICRSRKGLSGRSGCQRGSLAPATGPRRPGLLQPCRRETACARQRGTAPAAPLSPHSTPDKLSMRDSGNGGSECHDSDSETSGEAPQKASAEMAEKERGTTDFVKETSHRDTEGGRRLQLRLSSSVPFHDKHRDTFFCSAVQTYRQLPQTRKIYIHPELWTPSEGCSPVQSQRLHSVSERGPGEGTGPFEKLSCLPQNSSSASVSEIATPL